MNYIVRATNTADETKIFKLYKIVSKNQGGIAREEDEITTSYIKTNLEKSLKTGISLVIDHPENTSEIIAEIHCYQLEPKVFRHIFSELTIVIHPDFQGKGLGKLLFTELLNLIRSNRKDILRVELIARESNKKAIELYSQLNFKTEGRLEQRINTKTGAFEADIPMAWLNPNFEMNAI